MISLNTDDLEHLRVFELAPDLKLANAMKSTLARGRQEAQWKPYFWPEDYVKEGHSMKIDDNRLTDAKLAKLAKKVTKFRKIQRERAVDAKANFGNDNADAYLKTTERLARRMHKGYFVKAKEANIWKETRKTKRQRWAAFTPQRQSQPDPRCHHRQNEDS